MTDEQTSSVNRMRSVVRAGLAAVFIVALILTGHGAGQAQTSLADTIIEDSGVSGLDLFASESFDFAAEGVVAPEGEELPSGWVKAFSDGLDTITIIATEHPNPDALGASLAGAMAEIDREDRRLHLSLNGVVLGDTQQQGRDLRFALYGEALTSFTLIASGPNREQFLERVLIVQLDHSAGDRYPLRADENERYLKSRVVGGGSDLAYNLGRFAAWGLLAIGLVALIRNVRKRRDETKPPDPG